MKLRKIGPYRLEDKLGAGGMGEVFRAYDDRLDRWVALKLIRPEVLDSPEARRRFRREARAAARLSHPAIVQIHDILESETGDTIVMELVEGQPVSSLLAEGPLEIERVLALAREIAEGLAEAHAKEIVHRDLKADNVMVTPGGHAKILDFGLAKRLSQGETDLSVAGKILGTVHAMSPEQAQGFEVDHRSDLFSLGSLLYRAVTHQSPFQGDSPVQTLTRITTFRQTPAHEVNPQVPETLSLLIDRLLEKDPLHRPRDAGEVASALENIATTRVQPTLEAPSDTEDSDHTLIGPPSSVQPPSSAVLKTLLVSDLVGSTRRVEQLGDEAGVAPLKRPRDGDKAQRVVTQAADIPASRWRVGLMAALILLLLGLLGTWAQRQEERLYAAVLRPRILSAAEGQDSSLVAAAVRLALVQGLLSRQGISTPDTDQVDTVSGSAAQVARALGVDEVITSNLTCDHQRCQIELKRISGADGNTLWGELFEVFPGDLLELTSIVAQRLRNFYPDYKARPGVRDMEVEPGDYEEFLLLRRNWQTRPKGVSPAEILKAVTALESTSPRFPDAYLLEARIAQALFVSSKRPKYLERALDAVQRARDLAPEDSRALFVLFNIALEGARIEQAAEALEALQRVEPGHGRIKAQQALLLEARGQTAEALDQMRAAVERHASRDNLMDLARMEVQLGEFNAARNHLREVLERSPDNYQALFQLAIHEMTYGSLEQAIELFERLRRQSPSDAGTRHNIGLAYFGMARYAEATRYFLAVLDLEPSHLHATAALAFTQFLQGDTASARVFAGKALELSSQSDSGASKEGLHFLEAMALVALGEREQAVAAIQQILPIARSKPFRAWQAALIYAAVGEQLSAKTKAQEALRQGLSPIWLRAPLFDFLKQDPELRRLLEANDGRAGQASP